MVSFGVICYAVLVNGIDNLIQADILKYGKILFPSRKIWHKLCYVSNF